MGKFAELNEVLVILKDHAGEPGADPITGDFDLSKKFSVIEFENAEPQSIKITFNTRGGRFLTKGPIIKKRDRIYVYIENKNGFVECDDVFHIRNKKTLRGKRKPLSVIFTCPHQSENLWKSTVSYNRRGKRISGKRALELAVSDINSNKGAKDPTIEIPVTFDTATKIGNDLDPNTSNNYTFDSEKANTAVEEIKDIEKQPVEGGGSFAPVYVRFKSKYNHATGLHIDTVLLQAFEQGTQGDGLGNTTNIPTVTLKHPKLGSGSRPNTLSLDSDEDPELGTNLVAIGDKASGSYLRDWMMYVGAQDVFNSAKSWIDGTKYKVGHLVTVDGFTYECIFEHTSSIGSKPPFPAFWVIRFFIKPDAWNIVTSYPTTTIVRHQDIAYKSLIAGNTGNEPGLDDTIWKRVHFVPTVDYSPQTKNRVQHWINSLAGAKHAATNNGQTQMIDPNVIIDDPFHPRTYVRFVGKNPNLIPSEHLVDGNIPHGYKALVIDPTYLPLGGSGVEIGEGDWSGNDKNNIPFAGNIVQNIDVDFDGNGEWVVFKGKQSNQDQEVFDWDEGLPWIKNPCTGGTSYVDGNGVCNLGTRDADWLIGSYALSEIPFAGKVGKWIDGKQFECAHSVKWDSSNGRIDMSNEKISSIDDDGNSAVFVKSAPTTIPGGIDQNPFYVGLNFWSLDPLTSNAIPFGPVVAGSLIKLPVFDFDNMDLGRKGTSEWFGPLVEEYYPLQAYAAFLKLTINDSVLGIFDELDGDFTLGMYFVDWQDEVMLVEFPQSRNAKTLPIQGDLGKLKVYKGVPGVSAFFGAEEPNPTGSFDSSNVIFGGLYTRDSFDTQGRYLGLRSRFATKNEMKMSLDAWRGIKPLVATNVDQANNKPDVNIETLKIDKSSITSYAQLKNYILGLELFLNFDRRGFDVEIINGINTGWGDSVYYTDTEGISDADDGIPNTVKVVVNKITVTVSKTKNGPAGLKKTANLVRRVWP